MPATIAVFGLGNVLLGDDAAGPYVIELLRAGYDFRAEVTIADLGTPGLGLAAHLVEAEAAILIDAVSADGAPGELRLYRREEIDRAASNPRVSPHDPALKEALWLANLAGRAPLELLLVGIIPENVRLGVGISETLRRAGGAAVAAVLHELERLGAAATPRPVARPPETWWLTSRREAVDRTL